MMSSFPRRSSTAYDRDEYPLRGRRPSIASSGLASDDYYSQRNRYPPNHHYRQQQPHQLRDRDRDYSRGRRDYHPRPLDMDNGRGRDRFPRSRSRGLRVLEALEAGEGIDQAMQVMKREPSPLRRGAAPPRHHHRRRRSSSVSSDSSIEDRRRWAHEPERERGRSRARAYSQDRGRGRHGHGHSSRGRSRHHSEQPHRSSSKDRWGKQAARAALLAGVVEALRVRKDRGPWIGQKGSRVATAALGSAAIDAALASNQPDVHAGRHAFASTVGSMVVNRLANGKRLM